MRTLLLFILISFVACSPMVQKAQGALVPKVKGLYVDDFDKILGNTIREDSLLNFAMVNEFNYLTLYRLHMVNEKYDLTNVKSAKVLANFIKKAKVNYGIQQIGGAGENFPFFRDVLSQYNQQHADSLQKFNVFNLEFEFWVPNAVNNAYCSAYLKPQGYSCDTSGAFSFYIKSLYSIDSLAHLLGVLSETYLGWTNPSQSRQVGNTCDRVLLLDYVQNDKELYAYAQKRLHYFKYCTKKVTLLPIFSAEGGTPACGTTEFMGAWLGANTEDEAYASLMSDYNASTGTWKSNLDIAGYQWFDYSCLKANLNSKLRITTGMAPAREDKGLQIFNLEDNQIGLRLLAANSGNALITLTGMQGNLIFSQSVAVEKGVQTVQVPVTDIASGLYIVHCFLADGGVLSSKWIK